MAGDAEMQPAGSESLSDLAALLDDNGSEHEEQEHEEGQEEQEQAEEGQEHEEEDKGEQEGEAEDEPKEDPTVTIKHDGKEVTLKQSEVLELAQKGFDYSQKTMAVAEERKQVETLQAQASEYRQHQEKALGATLDRLNAFVQFMESQVGLPPPIELAQHDAASFLAQKQLYEDRKGQLTKAHEAIGNVTQETQRQRQAWIAKQAGDTEKALRDTLPGFDDNTINDLASYLDKVGINPQTADVAFVQKGVWELAQKAKAYDAILADKAKLKPVAQLAKVQKPSASNQPNRTQQGKSEAFKRYESKPTLANLAALL